MTKFIWFCLKVTDLLYMIRTLLQPPYHSRTFLTRDVYKTNALKAQICFFVDMGWILFVANLPKGEDVVFRFTGEKTKKKKKKKTPRMSDKFRAPTKNVMGQSIFLILQRFLPF